MTAIITISCSGKLLHSETFPTEVGRKIASFGKEHHCYTQTYEGPCFYYNEESVWARRYAEASSLTGVYVGDLEKYITQPRSKILMMDDEPKIAAMLKEARERFRGLASVTCSKPWFLEFNPLRATKGIALQTACSLLQIRIERTLAFGDSLNDLSMLQAAGRGVLMENGRQELRPLCDDICSSNQDDGVACYLKSVFREELS